MANSLAAIMPKILASGLLTLREQAVMPRLVNLDYSRDAAAKGDVINIPVPSAVATRAVAPSVTDPTPVNRTPTNVNITLDQWRQCDPFFLSDQDMHEIDRNKHFIPQTVSEAVRGLANEANAYILGKYTSIYGYVGTAATTPFASTTAAAVDARKILNLQLSPTNPRYGVVDLDAEANMLKLAEFADAEKIGSAGVKIEGEIGRKFGLDWM